MRPAKKKSLNWRAEAIRKRPDHLLKVDLLWTKILGIFMTPCIQYTAISAGRARSLAASSPQAQLQCAPAPFPISIPPSNNPILIPWQYRASSSMDEMDRISCRSTILRPSSVDSLAYLRKRYGAYRYLSRVTVCSTKPRSSPSSTYLFPYLRASYSRGPRRSTVTPGGSTLLPTWRLSCSC